MDRYQYANQLALSQRMHISIPLRAVKAFAFTLALAVLGSLLSVSPAAADTPMIAASGGSAPVTAELGVFPWTALVAGGSITESHTLSLPASASPVESDALIAPPQPLLAEPVVEALEQPTDPKHKDLWDRIRNRFGLPNIKGPKVSGYQTSYPKRAHCVQRMIERSRPYLYFIVEELEKRNMPSEIALLPIIESAYNPHAYSPKRAAGLWQFIPSTGRRYGLEQNVWYDGRRDVLAATRAALDYLQFLHDMFGDWQLALAAYNWGEGAVQRAIAHNRAHRKPLTYASLKMPNETRNYLPKLQALKNLVANPALLGFELPPIRNEPHFALIDDPGHIEVLHAAQLADMSVEEFLSLNPGYTRGVLIQSSARHSLQIALPIDKVDAFQTNLDNNRHRLLSWQPIVIQGKQTLKQIASQLNVSVERLVVVNGFARHKRLQRGQVLLVPVNGPTPSVGAEDNYRISYIESSHVLKQNVLGELP